MTAISYKLNIIVVFLLYSFQVDSDVKISILNLRRLQPMQIKLCTPNILSILYSSFIHLKWWLVHHRFAVIRFCHRRNNLAILYAILTSVKVTCECEITLVHFTSPCGTEILVKRYGIHTAGLKSKLAILHAARHSTVVGNFQLCCRLVKCFQPHKGQIILSYLISGADI